MAEEFSLVLVVCIVLKGTAGIKTHDSRPDVLCLDKLPNCLDRCIISCTRLNERTNIYIENMVN